MLIVLILLSGDNMFLFNGALNGGGSGGGGGHAENIFIRIIINIQLIKYLCFEQMASMKFFLRFGYYSATLSNYFL